jgi:hypothetical protein
MILREGSSSRTNHCIACKKNIIFHRCFALSRISPRFSVYSTGNIRCVDKSYNGTKIRCNNKICRLSNYTLHSRPLGFMHSVRYSTTKGRLHVSESAYESLYDSVQDLFANRIGSQFFSSMVCLQSYTESYGDLYGKSHV